MKEIWRDIKGYEGLYKVSNYGRIKSLERKDCLGRSKKEKILKLSEDKDGYLLITLHKNKKVKTFKVHRLVAETFVPNPNNYPIINHKDENKINNHVSNLEWCTVKYNNNYGTRNERSSKSQKGLQAGEKHPIYGKHRTEETKNKISKSNKGKMSGIKHPKCKKIICTTTGKKFDYIKQAGKFYKIESTSSISACCKGKRKSAGKHPVTGEKLKWEYIKE